MFQRIRDYELVAAEGLVYRPRAYGDPDPPGGWAGWIVFFPLRGGVAIAPPAPETRQMSLASLDAWAAGLTFVYLEGALARALAVARRSPVADQLLVAEYEALEEADAATADG